MKKIILIICCIGFYSLLQGQDNTNYDPLDEGYCIVEDIHTNSLPRNSSNDRTSIYGDAFTPKGDLRALVIFVDFEGSNNEEHPLNGWPAGQLPDAVDPITGKIDFAIDDSNDFSDLNNPDPDANLNISEFYYHMSNSEFRFLFETLKDNNGLPTLITIDVTDVQSYSALNSITFNKVRDLFPNRNWRELGFDNRTGVPDFSFDNATVFASPNPDGVLDYVITIYRDDTRRWVNHPNGEVAPSDNPAASGFSPPNAVAGGSTTSFSPLSTTLPPEIESFSTNSPQGFSYFQYSNSIPNVMRVFIHEVAHTFILHPHTSVENTVHGRYYNANRDWSMMDYGRSSSLASSWERWYSGWIDITHDLSTVADNGTYFIGDYMQTDDVIRLKLPHTDNQFLWLTFRSDIDNPFYTRTRGDEAVVPPNEPNSIPIDISNEGLYGLYERIAPSRSFVGSPGPSITTNPVFSLGANGTRIMAGTGFYDHIFEELINDAAPVQVNLIRDEPNPYGQLSDPVVARFDLNNNDEILNIPTTNGNGNPNEIAHIVGINGQRVFGPESENIDLPSGRRYSAFTNPPIQNFIEFDDFESNNEGTNGVPNSNPPTSTNPQGDENNSEATSPTILHSLSFVYRRVGDQARIVVNYNDGRIRNDFRMTGNVLLPAEEDIILNSNRTLTVNRSGTNNRETPSPAGDFINETVFKIAEKGSFRAAVGSTVILDEGSTTIFEENSELIMAAGSRIIIRGGALLCIKTTDVSISASNAQIIVEDGFLNVSSGIDISANVVDNNPFPFPTIADIINFCTPSNTPQHLHSNELTTTGRDVCLNNDVVITSGQSLQLTSQRLILMEPGFEAQAGSSYLAEIRTVIPQDCDIEFYFGSKGEPGASIGGGGFGKNSIDPIEELALRIFPNPSKDLMNIEIDNQNGPFSYQISDLNGRPLKEGRAGNNSFTLDISDLDRGVYIFIISNGTSIGNEQIVKL